MLCRHFINISGFALLLLFCLQGKSQEFSVRYQLEDRDSTAAGEISFLKRSFNTKPEAKVYLQGLHEILSSRGYAAASLDSIFWDSTTAIALLYLGKKYHWDARLDSLPDDVRQFLESSERSISRRVVTEAGIHRIRKSILDYYENTGYPFAEVTTENRIVHDTILTGFKVQKGVLYHIDSIRIVGGAKLKPSFLNRYLNIFDGDPYNKERLSKASGLIDNLPYVEQVQPLDLMMLGTGATLNLYLQPKRSSEVNALIGFLPANTITGKTKITADVRLNLKNALSGGESILINWQQLEAQTPRLDLGFNQPYLFNTPYGIDFSFGMLKQDSSYLKLNARLGIQYMWSANRYFRVFYQLDDSRLMQGMIDTNRIKNTRELPPVMDVHAGSGGLSLYFDNLDYLLNPRKGYDLTATISAGLRKVKPNMNIGELKDPLDPDFNFSSLYDTIRQRTYVVISRITGAHYSDLGKNSVLKLSWQAGWMLSPQIFQNELFRIGGYRLLRGFDEESIYADRYAVITGEYRLLTGLNSFLFGFVDYGLTHAKLSGTNLSNSFVSTGLGMELETKFGLLNVSYAIGKRNDIKFDIRNASKIHFGYINYF